VVRYPYFAARDAGSFLQQPSDAMAAFYTVLSDSSIAAADQVAVFTESELAGPFSQTRMAEQTMPGDRTTS
jgi:hypothetical protein